MFIHQPVCQQLFHYQQWTRRHNGTQTHRL